MEKTRKYCMQCGDPITGRQDKKFCSDHCRATHHNRQLASPRKTIRKINTILLRNRIILKQAGTAGYVFIPKEHLQDWGFNFGYFTHTAQHRKGRVVFFCYDKGYRMDQDGMVELMDPRKEFSGIIPPPARQIADPHEKHSPKPKR